MKIYFFEPFLAMGEVIGGDAKKIIEMNNYLKSQGYKTEIIKFKCSKRLIIRDIQLLLKLSRFKCGNKGDIIIGSGTPFLGFLLNKLGKNLNKILFITHVDGRYSSSECTWDLFKKNIKYGGLGFFFNNFLPSIKLLILNIPEFIRHGLINVNKHMEKIDLVVFSCEYLKNRFSTLNLKKAIVIYPGMDKSDVGYTDSVKVDETEFYSNIGSSIHNVNMNSNKIQLLYFGAFDSRRGIIDLILAYKKLIKDYPLLILNIAGYPVYTSATINLAKKIKQRYGLNNLNIYTHISNINEFVLKNDLIVLPFRHLVYQPPLVLLEAMALKKPIITSDCGCSKEFIQDQMMHTPSSISSLIEVLRSYLDSMIQDDSIGNYNLHRVNEVCNQDKYLDNIKRIIDEV